MVLTSSSSKPQVPQVTESWGVATSGFCLLVHGGAGRRPPEERVTGRQGCASAAQRAAADVLARGGSALDAVQLAVELLEDDPVFNAGTGGSLTEEGTLELDASIMSGADLRAGAVCSLTPHRHPIAIARAVLEERRHVLYAGAGAVAFAAQAGFAPAPPESMITAGAREQLARWLAARAPTSGGGTVGAVARDRQGRLAAATSTGGITGKRPGRVGDSPVIGAGTYADDLRGAASATGVGEGILRINLCARVVTGIAAGVSPQAASCEGLTALGERIGVDAGVIALAPDGRLGWARSTESMAWAAVWDGGSADGC
ncbi:MAG TPA: isoaspartyl peptidase/L-asparaginase family protein [Polyangiales bacterium]|nr:isoaspartyl peptidase/L-asparaginase family protein [Polyangiales bacterium]